MEIGSDIVCTPTSADAFADAVLASIDGGAAESRHLPFDSRRSLLLGGVRRRGFCASGVDCRVVAVDRKGDYGRIRRPAYSVLANIRGRALGIDTAALEGRSGTIPAKACQVASELKRKRRL